MIYEWICEKCGEENRSSQNICRSAPCRFVFHGTQEQTVTCAKCKRVPVGNSLYRTGRNTTFPLKRLTPTELWHKDYEVYGPAGRKFLDALRPYIGQYLCRACSPEAISLKIDTSFKDPHEASPEHYDRALADERALEREAAQIRERLKVIRKANPEMTREEEIAIARRLAHKIKDDEFLVDTLDWELRRIIRGAVASKVSFRKNIPKERIYEKLYRHWRIEEARSRHDMSHLRKVLREEGKRAEEIGKDIIDEARKGPDLFSTIERLTGLMFEKSNEIALKEHRIREERSMAYRYDAEMTILYARIAKLEAAFTASSDPEYLSRLGPILSRMRAKYSKVVDHAQHFLTPVTIAYEEGVIERMQRKFFTHYAPLLNVARGIIFWDIKRDLWQGPEGLTEEQAKSYGYRQYFDLPENTEYVEFGKVKGKEGIPYQKVSYRGYRPTSELAFVRCEICDKETQVPQLMYGMYALRRQDLATGQEMPLEVSDFISAEKVRDIPKESRGMIRRLDLVVCAECRRASNLEERASAIKKRQDRKKAEFEEIASQERQKRLIAIRTHVDWIRQMKKYLLDILRLSQTQLELLHPRYVAPIFKFDSRYEQAAQLADRISKVGPIDGEIKLMLIAVPGKEKLPYQIKCAGWIVDVKMSPYPMFPMNYAFYYLSDKERKGWQKTAKSARMTLTHLGLSGGARYGIMGDVTDVARMLKKELPPMPMGYWKGIHLLLGNRAVHPNFRDLVQTGSIYDFEPLWPYGKPSEEELARRKAIQMEMTRRRTERRKFWDPLRTRGKGGPSPKGNSKNKTRGLLQPHKETPMDPSKGIFEIKDPGTKDLTDFLMVPPPYRGDTYTRHMITVDEDRQFYREKGMQYLEDREHTKRIKAEMEAKFRKLDPKGFQKITPKPE